MYLTDDEGNETYGRDGIGQEVVEDRYARDKNGTPFYPRNLLGEFMDERLGIIERFGEYVYPITFVGTPAYRSENGKEVYEKKNGQWLIGRGVNGDEYYAKNEQNVEYYPADNTPARKADGSIFYASQSNKTIFPKDAHGHEYYLTTIDEYSWHTIPTRYALQGTTEIYPKRMMMDGLESDYAINNEYAQRNGVKYYPKDGYHNEMYIIIYNWRLGMSLLSEYAVTNDGKVILPSPYAASGQYYIQKDLNPPVSKEDILGMLIREKLIMSSDYVTKVDGPVKPQVEPVEYKYYAFKTNIITTVSPPRLKQRTTEQRTWYVVWIIALLVEILLMGWFVYKYP